MKQLIILIFVFIAYACNTPKSEQPETLAPAAFAEQLKSDPEIILLDVRTPEEVQDGFIDGAVNVDFNGPDFGSKIDGLDRSKKYFVYCAAGGRSSKAQDLMKKRGFHNVTGLDGGMKSWAAAGLPIKQQ